MFVVETSDGKLCLVNVPIKSGYFRRGQSAPPIPVPRAGRRRSTRRHSPIVGECGLRPRLRFLRLPAAMYTGRHRFCKWRRFHRGGGALIAMGGALIDLNLELSNPLSHSLNYAPNRTTKTRQ